MRAGDGVCMVSCVEVEILLKALDGRNLTVAEYEVMKGAKRRMWDSVARHEKTMIMREIQPEWHKVEAREQFSKSEYDWWLRRCVE